MCKLVATICNLKEREGKTQDRKDTSKKRKTTGLEMKGLEGDLD